MQKDTDTKYTVQQVNQCSAAKIFKLQGAATATASRQQQKQNGKDRKFTEAGDMRVPCSGRHNEDGRGEDAATRQLGATACWAA